MNCVHVEQLLPLYIGSDLEDERSTLVTNHLRSCERCAQAANEYAQAKQLLQQLEAPSFGDAVYVGIRRQVVNEIEGRSHAPAWSQFFASLAPARVRWITAALVLAMSVTALYFITKRSNQIPPHVTVADGSTRVERGANTLVAPIHNKSANDGPVRRRPRQRQKANVSVARREILPSRTAPANALALPNNSLAQPFVGAAEPASASAPLRVEIQISDRNIRIIWLTSERHQNGVRETSKGI